MQGHGQVELVSRDRSTDYSSAIAALEVNPESWTKLKGSNEKRI
jgi:hypothetical protein